MPDYGLTTTGFLAKSLDILNEEAKARLRARLGNDLPLLPQSVLGVVSGEEADMLSEAWAVLEALWFAFDESAAEGAALENLSAITGTERLQASPSAALVTATGDTGTVLPTQRVVSVPATGIRFQTTQAVTLAAVSSWQVSTAYAVGARVTTNVGAARVYRCFQAGASASSGTGPSGTGTSIADGTCLWRYLGEGAAAVDVPALCTVTGPSPAVAGSLTGIETPVSGWRSATNVQDAVLGRNVETDAELRIRRRQELRGLGNASVDAIRERLLDASLVPGVTAANVFENDTDDVNSDGMPPHSVEALVEGGDDQAIRDTILSAKAAGIRAYGTVTGTAADAAGNLIPIAFTRPTIFTIYFSATVQLTPDAPGDDAQVQAQLNAALLAYGDALPAGRDVVLTKAVGALTAIPWVFDVVTPLIGTTSGSLSTSNIPVTTRQRADFDTSRNTFTLQRLTASQL